MRDIITLVFFLLSSIFNSFIFSQDFEGEINFEINHLYKDTSLVPNRNLPTIMNYYISGEYAKVDQFTVLGNQSLIKDTLTKKSVLLIQILEDKIGIILNNENDSNEITQIDYLNDFKTILNFNCQKAVINAYNKLSGKNSTTVVYFTDEISNAYCNNFNGLNGFPLFYEIEEINLTSTYSASKISKKTIDPKEFEVSKNTKTYTLDQFKLLMNQ